MDSETDYDWLIQRTCMHLGDKTPQFCSNFADNLEKLDSEDMRDELLNHIFSILFDRNAESMNVDITCAANQADFSSPKCDLAPGDFFCEMRRETLPQKEKSINFFLRTMEFLDLQSIINAAHSALSIIDEVDSPIENDKLAISFLRTFPNVFSTMPFKEEFSLRSDYSEPGCFEAMYVWDVEKFQEKHPGLWSIVKKIQMCKLEFKNHERTQNGLVLEISNVGIKASGYAKDSRLVWFHESGGRTHIGDKIPFDNNSQGVCSIDVTWTMLTMFGFFPLQLPQIFCKCNYEASQFKLEIEALGPPTTLEFLAGALVPFDRIRQLLVQEFSQTIGLDSDNNINVNCHVQLPHINSFLVSILKMITSNLPIKFFSDFFRSFAVDLENIWNLAPKRQNEI